MNRRPKRERVATAARETFFADALRYLPGQCGRKAWGRELLRARSPQALLRMLDGRPHIAYASNGRHAIRIALIDTGGTILAPIWPKAEAEPLQDLLTRIAADPNGWSP